MYLCIRKKVSNIGQKKNLIKMQREIDESTQKETTDF